MGLLPCNDPALVEEAADLLGVPSSTVFSLSVPQGNPGDLKPAFAGAAPPWMMLCLWLPL